MTVKYSIPSRRVMSPNIWNSCPIEELTDHARSTGGFIFDDFLNSPAYKYYTVITGSTANETNNTFDSSSPHTVLMITDDDDEDFIGMGTGPLYKFAASTTTNPCGNRCWFEARYKLPSVSSVDGCANVGSFIGLGTVPVAVTHIANGGALSTTSVNFVGFHQIDSVINMVFSKASGTATTIVAAEATAVDDTFYKLGFYFDGLQYMKVYADNVLMHTEDIKTLLATGTTTFPIALMGMIAMLETDTTAVKHLALDWWAFGWEGDRTS